MSPLGRAFVACAFAGSLAAAGCAHIRSGPVDADAGRPAGDAGSAGDAPAVGARSSFRVVREGGPGLNTVFGFSSTDVYAGGENSTLLHFTGSEWEPVNIAIGVEITCLWGKSANDLYAAGVYRGTGRGILYHYDGESWNEEHEFPHGLLFVRGVGDAVFVGGLSGAVFKKTPTKDWYQLIVLEPSPYVDAGPNAPVLFSLAANAPDKMLVAGDLNLIYYFIGTSQWVPTYDPVDRTRAFKSAWAPPSTDWLVYVGANYNGIWLSTGKDEKFIGLYEEKDTPAREEESIWGIWGTSAAQVIFVGDKGRMFARKGQEYDVEELPSPTKAQLGGVWGASWNDVFVVGANGTVLRGSVKF